MSGTKVDYYEIAQKLKDLQEKLEKLTEEAIKTNETYKEVLDLAVGIIEEQETKDV